VVRGGPVRRSRDVRVRLTPGEHAAWSAARAATGRRELGAWVRVTVNELLGLPADERPRLSVAREQMVDVKAYLTLVAAANALHGLVAQADAEDVCPAGQHAVAVYREVRDAAVEIRAAIAVAAARARLDGR
jgi:hypothetical protein